VFPFLTVLFLIGGLVSVVAQDIVMTVETLGGAKITKTWTKFRSNQQVHKSDVMIGDIQSEEQKDILFHIKVPKIQAPSDGPVPIAKITLKYLNLQTNRGVSLEATVAIRRPGKGEPVQKSNFIVDKERNRLLAAESMEEALRLGNEKKLCCRAWF